MATITITQTDCTPSALTGVIPCLSCLSEKELLTVLVFILASADSYSLPTDTNQLLADSACFTCLSDKQLFQALITAVANEFLRESLTVEEGAAAVKCLQCANPKQLKAALVYLLCQLFSTPVL